jgi:NADH:ubiquinone oxidoreductase subunit K
LRVAQAEGEVLRENNTPLFPPYHQDQNITPTMTVKRQPLPLTAVLSTLLLAATNVHAFKMSNLLNGLIVDEIMTSRHLEEAASDEGHDLYHPHVGDVLIVTVAAWLVAVVVRLFCLIFSI